MYAHKGADNIPCHQPFLVDAACAMILSLLLHTRLVSLLKCLAFNTASIARSTEGTAETELLLGSF